MSKSAKVFKVKHADFVPLHEAAALQGVTVAEFVQLVRSNDRRRVGKLSRAISRKWRNG